MTDKEGKQDADYHHMILLARDDVGYRNLLALTTAAHLDHWMNGRNLEQSIGASSAYRRTNSSCASSRSTSYAR